MFVNNLTKILFLDRSEKRKRIDLMLLWRGWQAKKVETKFKAIGENDELAKKKTLSKRYVSRLSTTK